MSRNREFPNEFSHHNFRYVVSVKILNFQVLFFVLFLFLFFIKSIVHFPNIFYVSDSLHHLSVTLPFFFSAAVKSLRPFRMRWHVRIPNERKASVPPVLTVSSRVFILHPLLAAPLPFRHHRITPCQVKFSYDFVPR